jgi:hypothetical protein
VGAPVGGQLDIAEVLVRRSRALMREKGVVTVACDVMDEKVRAPASARACGEAVR